MSITIVTGSAGLISSGAYKKLHAERFDVKLVIHTAAQPSEPIVSVLHG